MQRRDRRAFSYFVENCNEVLMLQLFPLKPLLQKQTAFRPAKASAQCTISHLHRGAGGPWLRTEPSPGFPAQHLTCVSLERMACVISSGRQMWLLPSSVWESPTLISEQVVPSGPTLPLHMSCWQLQRGQWGKVTP